MKILIVCFGNLRSEPYIYSYFGPLNEEKATCDIVYWNRSNLEENAPCHRLYRYDRPMDDRTNKIRKFAEMRRFSQYVKKIIQKNQYDRLIITSTLPAVFLSGLLNGTYRGRYILDIRDHSYEHISFFYRRLDRLMEHSALNVISSEGFRNFLPPRETVLCHNFNHYEGEHRAQKARGRAIRIAFVGGIRYADAYLKFLDAIKDDPRIRFDFYGFGEDTEKVMAHCRNNAIRNVQFHGAYKPSEKAGILAGADVLFNVYGTGLHVKYAISNKYYDALSFQKPILVSKGTTMEAISQGICYAVDDSFCLSEFLDWYDKLDMAEVQRICEEKLAVVSRDMEHFCESVKDVLKAEGE